LRADLDVSSAGLYALVGHAMDSDSLAAAHCFDIAPQHHRARQFDIKLGQEADLILVMEDTHRRDIGHRWPQLLGKTFLLGYFEGGKQIIDPYKRGSMMHVHMAEQVLVSARLWAKEIEKQ
jgi:protein-tyrosine phosphatase